MFKGAVQLRQSVTLMNYSHSLNYFNNVSVAEGKKNTHVTINRTYWEQVQWVTHRAATKLRS